MKEYENAATDEKQMQRSSKSDVAVLHCHSLVYLEEGVGIRGKKGECESPTNDMVRISKPSLGLGHLPDHQVPTG